MTAPKITYGHGKLEDVWATLAADYTLTSGGSTGSYGVTAGQDLYVTISAFVGDSYVKNDDNLGLSTTIYTKLFYRYKTTGNATAKIIATFNDAHTQTILAETASTSWKIGSVTLNTAETLGYISLYCCDGEGTAYFDFFLVCKAQYTFPQYAKLTYSMRNRYSNTDIFTRVGRRKGWMGADETIINIAGDVDSNRASWKRTSDVLAAQVLNDIHHNASSEAWQWLVTDRGQFKAVMDDLAFTESAEGQPYLYMFNATFSENRVSDGSTDSLTERLGTAEL